MKVVKTIGLGLFFIGFILFNTLFFSAKYVLTESVIKETFSDSARSVLFLEASSPILNKEEASVFSFVSELKETFETANQNQFSIYGITQEEVLDLVARSGKKFSIA